MTTTDTSRRQVDIQSLLTLYSKGTRVWIVDDTEGWRGAIVQSQSSPSADSLTVGVCDERNQTFTFTATKAQLEAAKGDAALLPPLRNPPLLEGIEDLTSLSHLHEPAVLHNLRTRYGQHNIYTYSGIVLIAMNPFQRLPHLYTSDIVKAYSGKRRGELEPHLFAVAEDAFRGMIRDKKNQSIIVSGESGAGKTVSAKYIMRYFATADASDSATSSSPSLDKPAIPSPPSADASSGMSEVEQQVLATNPIICLVNKPFEQARIEELGNRISNNQCLSSI